MSSNALPYAKSVRERSVCQKQRPLSREVFKATKASPLEGRYSVTDQLRRAARSIGTQIAESWAKRGCERHFVSTLSEADAGQMETPHWIETAKDDGLLTTADRTRRLGLCEENGRMLGSMIERASSFCTSTPLRERITDDHFTAPSEPRITEY